MDREYKKEILEPNKMTDNETGLDKYSLTWNNISSIVEEEIRERAYTPIMECIAIIETWDKQPANGKVDVWRVKDIFARTFPELKDELS